MRVNGHKRNGTMGQRQEMSPGPTFRYEGEGYGIVVGDAWHSLEPFPARSFRCCVTSPPYWGLRDYGIPNQIGAEKGLETLRTNLASVFQQVKRLLRDADSR